ncbi:DUF6090 family protein [Polaribacter sp. SA4-10]|uniref:DUF6090 family protein n=1 Tax=Polaribacter sp. SA4-10 TaxID=754397 RepID=UPI0018E064D6|nr:DUF6090 family protein [Polaribacter sp. SA4-10]|tara:strand:+ start:313 stop:1026 length:714 start_codon:yes stop_codon:yes gene_type:complete
MENKTGTYFKYAIGEIILVVIGILIALSINNWNENRKNSNEEIAILQSLDKNLILAKKQSESLVSTEKDSKAVLLLVLGIDTITDKNSISDNIFKDAFWSLENNIPVINTYADLKNSNKLGLIKNQKIKEKFTSLEVNLNKLKGFLDDRLHVQQIRIDDVSENEINFIPLIKSSIPTINITNEKQNNYEQIINNQRIRNLLGIKLNMTQDVLNYRENLDKEIKELIMLIESELHKYK